MKRIISFVLCLSMLLSMLPVSVFASDVAETIPVETTPVTEAVQETETAAPTEAPETTAETAAQTAAAAAETTVPATVPEETLPQETEAEIIEETLTYIPDMDLPGNEELFAAYAEHVLYGTNISLLGTAAGERLSGNAKVAYKALVPVIREIASGQRSSSAISVGYNGEVDAQFPIAQFTYEDLVAVLNALLADLPYELYWFDKVTGIATSSAVIGGKLRVTFRLCVAANYSAAEVTGTYDLDTAKTGAATAAVAKTQSIVDAYQSASDYDKLVGYKKEICNLTSYNTSAASNMNFSGNDDPWQLIYVFDGLQSTKVVCEGYTKAFQYLCDLTNFQNDIICYQVNGTMKGGTGAGSHMWNIVGINGKHYLADITNSDTGTIGANGKLFLAGGTAAEDGSYTIGGVTFTYSSSTLALWGTEDGSILNLEPKKYDPNVAIQSPGNGTTGMTGEELEAALAGISGPYELNCPVVISNDFVVPSGVYLQLVGSDATMTIQDGSSVTVNSFLGVTAGGAVVAEEGSKLTLNGTLSVGQGGNVDVYGTLEHNAKLECAGSVKVYGTYVAGEDAYITIIGSGSVQTEVAGPPTNAQELVEAVNAGGEVAVWDHITITENTVLSSESLLSFADFAKLTVTNGATLTLNCPTMINGAQLIVDEGATLISNVDLSIADPHGNGGCATFNGSFENNGSFWVNVNSFAEINGYAFSAGPIFVGFGGAGRLSVNGQLDACAHTCVNEGGELNLSPGAKLNLLGAGGGYLDNKGHAWLNGEVYMEGLMSSGARRDEETGEVVGSDAIIEIRGSVTGTGTSLIAVGEKGSIDCYGPVTTAGEVIVEKNSAFWVDHSVTLAGPVTVGGYLHVDYFDEFATANGVLNLEGTANVSGYLQVCDGGTLNVTKAATLNILNDENGCGHLDNHGGAWIHGTMNLDGLCTSGNEAIENGYSEGGAILDIMGSLKGSETSSIGVLKGGSMNFNGPGTTDGELIVEQGGVLWVDNVLTVNGPAPFIVNGGAHVNFFDEPGTPTGVLNLNKVPHEEDGVVVDPEVAVGGYLAICQGAVLNTSETTPVRILNNEVGSGYIDNQGTANMKGTLYVEGLFTTGAAKDESGNVTGSPATARIDSDIAITETGIFAAGTDGSITLGNVTNRGTLAADPGGKLIFKEDACLDNYGGYVPIAEGGYQSEGFSFMFNHLVDGNFGGVEGFPADRAYLHCYPDSVYAIKRLVSEFETGKYVDGTIQIESDFVIDEDITLPEGTGIMLIVTEGDAKPTLTIAEGVTVTNNGGIYVFENTTLVVDGEIVGNAPVNRGGTVIAPSADPQTRFERLLASSDNPHLTFDVELTRDVEINGDLWIMEGATLTIPRGITVTVNNRIFVNDGCALITKSGSKLVNNLTVGSGGGTITLAPGTHVYGNEDARVENTYDNGHFGTITGIPVTEQRMFMALYTEEDFQVAQDVMRDRKYSNLSVAFRRDIVLEDLTIPANTALNVGELVLENEITVTINGTLTLEDPETSHLHVREDSTLVLNGTAYNHGEVQVGGTLKLGSGATFNNQGGWLHNHGSSELGFQENVGTIECSEGAFVFNTLTDGALGEVTGVPYEHLGADARVESIEELYTLFEQASPEQYCDITVVTEKSLTLTRDLEIPHVGFINVLSRDGSPVTLTIPEEFSLTNHGYIYVVGEGAELLNNGYINSFGELNAMEGGTVTLNGVLDVSGHSVIDGTLVNNAMIWVDNDASLEIAEYIGTPGSFNVQAQKDVGSTCASITGIPVHEQTLCVNVSSQSDIDSAMAYSEENGYGWTILIITDSFSLTRDLTIPENCFFLMNPPMDEDGNVTPITFTVPEHVTVTRYGHFEVPGNATVVIDGMWIGEVPITWGGGILTGSYFEMTQAKFEQWLNSGGEDLWLNSQVILETDLVIDRHFAIGPTGSITVPEGVTLTLESDIWIDEGWLVVEGTLVNNNHIGITGGEITVSGTYEQAEWANLHVVSFDDGYYDHPVRIEGIDLGLQTLVFDYDDPSLLTEYLAQLDGYRDGFVQIRGDFTLNESIMIPENVHVNICNDIDWTPVLTVPKIHTLINYGTIEIGYDGHLIVDGTFTGNLPALTDETAEFTVNGRLAFGQDELEAMLDRGGDVNLTVPLVLNRDLVIPGHANLNIRKGGQLVVPGGKTLYVEGNIHVEYSVDKMGNGQPGLVLESGKLVNNGLISVFNLGLFDASNGTYEQAEWAVLDRIYRADDHDSEIPFLAAEILGIPNGLVTIGVDYPNLETIRVVSAIAAWAEQNGEPFREIRYTIERSITLDDDLVIPENGYLWIGQQFHDPFVTLTVPEGVTLTNHNIIEITTNGQLVMEGQLEGYQPWTTGGGEYISSTSYTEAEFRADLVEAFEKNQQVFLCRPVTLTKDLTVPAGMCLTIGLGGQLVVPQGVTLTVEGDLQVLESDNWEGNGEAGLLLQGGKLVNNGSIIAEGFGLIDASGGTYEQADWAQLQRIYHDYDGDIHPADIIGIPMNRTTLIAAEASEELVRMLLAIADWAGQNGDPFHMVQIELNNRELRLAEDLTIPANTWLRVTDFGTLIVPNGVTVTNRGGIDIYWAGTVIVEQGGTIVGNHPTCVDTGAEYINENGYDQDDLEALIAENRDAGYAVLSVPVTLERNLAIPADFTLIITGRDNFITIPAGTSLSNYGTIACQMFGGILAQGGSVYNSGVIHVLNWGTVDLSDGRYESRGGMIYNQHYRWSDGYEEHATVVGFHPSEVEVITGGNEDSILHELIGFINSVSQDGIHSNMTSEIYGDMTLTGDLYWPGYATMTIPEGVTVVIPEGVTLDNQGTIHVYGQLIVEGTLMGRGQLFAENPDNIIGNVSGSVTVPGVELTHFLVGVSERTISPGSYTQLWIEDATPYAEVYGYRYRIISGDASVFGNDEYYAAPNERVDIYSNWSERTDPILVQVAPIIGYNENGEICPEELTQTVTINVVDASANIWWNCSNWFYDEINGIGVYAGTKFTMGGFLYNSTNGEWLDGTARLDIQGANEFVTIKQNTDGSVTISSDKKMTEGVVLTITSIPDVTYGMVVAPFTMRIAIRPCVNKANLLLNGETVTGKTVTFDLNRGQEDLWLEFLTDPADASGGIILDINEATGEPIFALSYKSSNEKIATVDQWGNVHFTGTPGKVKITATASLSKKVTATVTFNAVEMAQEISPAEGTVTQLIGGKGATYTVVDENGNTVKAKDVSWFLCNEWGDPIESSPYAAIKNGKLTTKAVIDPYDVYLMAQLVGDEYAARLAEPVCVTLYPAVSSVSILNPDGYNITGQTIPWDFVDMADWDGAYYLGWNAAPCADSIKEVTWKSSKPAVAEILDTGLILPTGDSGTVKFTMTAVALDGKKTTASVTFQFGAYTRDLELYANLPDGERRPLEGADLDGLVITSGESITFEAYTIPKNVTTKGVNWTFADPAGKSFATISAMGVLKAKNVTNPETVIVGVESKDKNCGYSIFVTILPKPVKVGGELKDALLLQNDIGEYVTKATLTLTPGTETTLYATDDVTWKSSNASVVTIDDDGGLKTLKNGTAKITATAGDGRKAEVTIKVGKLAESIEITTKKGEPFTVASGKGLDLVARITYSDGSVDTKANWSVSHTGLAKIAASGKITATKGLTEATAVEVCAVSKDGQVETSVTVEILPLSVGVEIYGPFDAASSYDVDVSNTTQKWDMTTQGSTFYLYAGLFPYDAMQAVTWKSSSAKVVTIDENGKVTCLAPGSVTITATAKDGSGKKASFKLAVSKTMAYLTLPQTATVRAGDTLTMTKLEGFSMDTLATNKTLTWTLLTINGDPVPASIASLIKLDAKGVMKPHKSIVIPMNVVVRVEANDGSGLWAECIVSITAR